MDTLAAVAERIASNASRNRKIAILAEYLRGLSDEDLPRAVRFFMGATPERVVTGYVQLRDAAIAASGVDPEIFRICVHDVGDLGETIGLVMMGKAFRDPSGADPLVRGGSADPPGRSVAERPSATSKPACGAEPLSLSAAEGIYRRLASERRQAAKFEILRDTFTRCRPLTLKYFVKVMAGELRIGLQQKMVEEAVALAAGSEHAAVREASNRSGDLPRVALAARRGELGSIEARLFHPMDFMLAKPIDSLEEVEHPEEWIIEDKYDGIRAQAHVADGRAVIFTRGLAEATAAFPELESALEQIQGSALLDGEIVAWQEGRALHFNVLQQRLARKAVPLFMPLEVPVVFVAYDLLYRNGELLLDVPIEQRRTALEAALAGVSEPLLTSPQHSARAIEEVAGLFAEARNRGNEGLVLKRRGSIYEAGRRTGEWIKWKQPYATLDVVITAAEQGHGKRATVLSDYTFAVRSGNELVNIGKAYSGLTDAEIRELTGLLRGSATTRHGPVLIVRPEIVLEVAFDSVQPSARHKSGFALRFPRIVRWRRDKRPEEIDGLERVRELYERSLKTHPRGRGG